MSLPYLQLTGPDVQHRQLFADTINAILKGRANNVGSFTLAANTTTTTVTDPAFESSMVVTWMPTTANAAGAMTNLYVSARDSGTFTLTHSNAATVDRTFYYMRWG
jgi:hypothetical protein